MRKLLFIVLSGILSVPCGALWGADWASQGGNPQRDGWARGESELGKDNAQELQLLYKTNLDNESKGLFSLTSPIILTNLITYRGFKEMLFVGGSSDNIYSIDAALNRLLWKTHFEYKGDQPAAAATPVCPGGLTASPAILGGTGESEWPFHIFRKPAKGAGAVRRPARPAQHGGLFSTGFGSNGYVFAIGGDGYLRFVRQSDGNDSAVAPLKFLPPNSRVTGINVSGTTVYAATVGGCGGHPNALYAVDLGGPERNVVSFATNGSGFSGQGGTVIGANGTVYAQVENGRGDVAGTYNDTVLALNPNTLKVEDYFTPSGSAPAVSEGAAPRGVTPAAFSWKGKHLIVAAGRDGTVYLLDAASLGGADHHTPLYRTEPIAAAHASEDNGIRGDFSTWEDSGANTRWIYAALWGSSGVGAKFPATNGDAANGSIVAFTLDERDGRPALTPRWISRNLVAPAPPVTANGLVFALSSGQAEGNAHATMYALDAATGKELFSTGDAVATFSHGSGLAVANDRVYFTTHDNTIYCYGLPALEPQLTER